MLQVAGWKHPYIPVCPCEEEGKLGWDRHSLQEASEHVIFLQMARMQAM